MLTEFQFLVDIPVNPVATRHGTEVGTWKAKLKVMRVYHSCRS